MKNAPTTYSDESAPNKRNYNPGTMPIRRNTVTSAVLVRLLESNVLTGMDSVFKESTTRLSAVIYRLKRDYGWHIERRDIVTGTNDGRIASITAYWLPQSTIAEAFGMEAREWIESVKAARAKRRQEASKCKAAAAQINAARRQCTRRDPRQGALWDAN